MHPVGCHSDTGPRSVSVTGSARQYTLKRLDTSFIVSCSSAQFLWQNNENDTTALLNIATYLVLATELINFQNQVNLFN